MLQRFWGATKIVLINLLILEVLAFIILLVLKPVGYYPVDRVDNFHVPRIQCLMDDCFVYEKYSSELGWTVRENAENIHNNKVFSSNSAGARGKKEYSYEIPDSTYRILAFGDSFTFGGEVSDDENWPFFLEDGNHNLEVINFGLGAWGTDQAYIRYQLKSKEFETDVVLIGFMFENVLRNVNIYRPFYVPESRKPLTKPRFKIEEDSLVLVPNPISSLSDYSLLLEEGEERILREFGNNDYWYPKRFKASFWDYSAIVRGVKLLLSTKETYKAFYSPNQVLQETEYYRVSLKIIEEFYEEVLENGDIPVIVFFPNKVEYSSLPFINSKPSQPMISYFKEKGYNLIDIRHQFDTHNLEKKDIFLEKGQHYNAYGNQQVAEYIKEFLYMNGLVEQ